MIDIDGVGFTFSESVYNFMKVKNIHHLWKSGPTTTPYWNWYRDWGWTDAQFVEFCHEAADAGVLFSGPVRHGYKEMLQAISNMGHSVVIATDRSFGSSPRVSEELTLNWLRQHDLHYDELIFTSHKPDSDCDMGIDDKIENYDALVDAGTFAALLTRPWNERNDARIRVDTLEQFTQTVAAVTEEGLLDLSMV